jgi:hypothetical protein
MIRIFISYRHRDCPDLVHQLHDYLAEKLDHESIFMDVNRGFENLEELIENVRASDVLLAMIGPEWVSLTKEKFDKSVAETDWVLREIETGLQTDGVLVIPVLMNGAPMPTSDQIPGSIQGIIGKRGFSISQETFETDAARLLQRTKDRHKRYCGATRVHTKFPTDVFVNRLRRARRNIRVLVIWSSLLYMFSEPMKYAMLNGTNVQLLLLNPDSLSARQRSKDLQKEENYTAKRIWENVGVIKQQILDLKSEGINPNQVELKFYDATPSRTIYIADESAFVGTHPPRIMSIHSHHTEVFGEDTDLYRSLEKHFNDLWEVGIEVPLDAE